MIQEGQWLWSPSKEFVDNSFMTKFMTWLSDHRGLTFASYADLHNWSVTELDAYWSAVWSFFDIQTDAPFKRVLDAQVMPDTKWFEGARVNYAEHVLSRPGTRSWGSARSATPSTHAVHRPDLLHRQPRPGSDHLHRPDLPADPDRAPGEDAVGGTLHRPHR